jgi:hypothetical protein
MVTALRRAFGQAQPYPAEHRRNFNLLFLDVIFWGILNGSTVVFLAVYASRLGASATQVGFLTASPALMNILFSFAASNFSRGKSVYQITRWAWLFTRIGYGFLVPLPLLLPSSMQIWAMIGITLAMNIPGTVAAVIGNAFFADAVPLRFRGSVVGTRNALVALTSTLTSLMVGLVLKSFSLEVGYTIVFAMGFAGSAMSLVTLFLIQPVKDCEAEETPMDAATPPKSGMRFDIVRGEFGKVALIVFVFQAVVFWANPIFPLYQVHTLQLNDQTISQGTSLFWVVYFLVSTQTGRLSRKWGFRALFGVGTLGSGLALLIITFAYPVWMYMSAQVVSGTAWALIGGGLINYVLERVPADDRPAHLAWYNWAVNVAILLCGLLVPQLLGLNQSGSNTSAELYLGMLLGSLFRFLGGILILWLG